MAGGWLGLFQNSLSSAARLLPGSETASLMIEMANRVEAFSLFQEAGTLLGQGSERLPLRDLFAKAASEGGYRSAWLIEGASHLYSRTQWKAGIEPEGILSNPEAVAGVPENLVTLAHVGLAASLAERVLADIPATGLDGAIARFRRLSLSNARAGYDQMCVELLGFVISMLSPGLAHQASSIAGRLFPDAEDYFWHGAGRAAYFSVSGGIPVPGAHERAIHQIEASLPHSKARANATAGWAWALTLVNIRQPDVVKRALASAGKVSRHAEAVTEGAGSGLRIWTEISPQDELAAPHGLLRPAKVPTRELFRYASGRCTN